MPRNVRNFWISAEVDGRNGNVGTGPRSKDGGFVLYVQQRDGGRIIEGCRLIGTADDDGALTLTIVPNERADFALHAHDGRITISSTR